MPSLLVFSQVRTYLVGIRDNTNEDPLVRAKAAEVLALFDVPLLSEIQATFTGGTTAQKLGALGQLQSAIVRGRLRTTAGGGSDGKIGDTI